MTTATAETTTATNKLGPCERVFDVANQAAHISDEARRFKSLAADAVEDGIHAARRATKSVRRYIDECADLKAEAAHRVKRQPFKAIGYALGVGIVLGIAVGWIGSRCERATDNAKA